MRIDFFGLISDELRRLEQVPEMVTRYLEQGWANISQMCDKRASCYVSRCQKCHAEIRHVMHA